MDKIFDANWIRNPEKCDDSCVIFKKQFNIKSGLKKATLQISALGIYEVSLNGEKVGDAVLAPGWTSYKNRVFYETYDVTDMLSENNEISVLLGRGWRFRMSEKDSTDYLAYNDTALIAYLELEYADGSECIITDNTWKVSDSKIRYSNIYNGDVYDATFEAKEASDALIVNETKDILVRRQGEKIKEFERLPAKELIITPSGETVIDFGQNMTGYVEFNICGKMGDEATILHAEILDKDGNFYTENLRAAEEKIVFICDGESHTYRPKTSFQGFRYIKLVNWPDEVDLANFTAIVVHSDMKRTGLFECSAPMVNQLYHNIIWGQKGNFLDVPTDCPQRDERLGWTGDAQVFCRTATYNFDVEKFFTKWLADLALDQREDGKVHHIIPNCFDDKYGSAAWGDASTIVPWQVYLTYGNKEILVNQFESMKKWIEYIKSLSENYIWCKGDHFGDWLALDVPFGEYVGATDKKLIATAFFAYSTSLVVKAGKVIGEDVSEYEKLYDNIVKAYQSEYLNDDGTIKNMTQTGCVLTVYFDLYTNKENVVKQLAEDIKACGHLKTGFVGTPYLAHVLSDNGYPELAYDLLLRTEYPSWLYPITKGATTIWEHWDGIKPDGELWSKNMNSFNHYAYGAIGDWLYGRMVGINTDEQNPGFRHIIFNPCIDSRITYAKASIEARHGTVKASWKTENNKTEYTVTVPENCTATVLWNGNKHEITKGGTYMF